MKIKPRRKLRYIHASMLPNKNRRIIEIGSGQFLWGTCSLFFHSFAWTLLNHSSALNLIKDHVNHIKLTLICGFQRNSQKLGSGPNGFSESVHSVACKTKYKPCCITTLCKMLQYDGISIHLQIHLQFQAVIC